MSGSSSLIDIEAIYQTTTERGLCIRDAEDGPDIWLPIAHIEASGNFSRGGLVTITLPEWLAQDKGLI